MRIMNARNFRASFTALDEPVLVISREKVIGTWSPTAPEAEVQAVESLITDLRARYPDRVKPAPVPMSQAERDAILRRVNKG